MTYPQILNRHRLFSAQLLTLAVLLSRTSAQAQDYVTAPVQVPVVVQPGHRLKVTVKFSAANENAVLIIRQATGERQKAFNSIFGRRPDYPYEHEQPGGGEWRSDVASVPTVYVIYGNNKPTAREGGGGGVPWRLSRYRVFFESKTAAIVGFEDGADLDFNEATVEISIE
jgi:hypothetical protein